VGGTEPRTLATRHLRLGWWGLAVFIVAGGILELFHAIKAPFYLDAAHETTRLLFRLAHAHGTGLSLVHVAFGLTVRARPRAASDFASAALVTALILLPLGFFAGGVGASRGDPGLGILLVPAGALALLAGVVATARRIGDDDGAEPE
jgi:hypothetical protein